MLSKYQKNAEQDTPTQGGELQGDSTHSSMLQSVIGAAGTGARALGFGSFASRFLDPLSSISNAIGNMTGMTGIFDQPSVVVNSFENANATVDMPQTVHSLMFHKDDFVDDQHAIVSGSALQDDLMSRLRIPTRMFTVEWSKTRGTGYLLTAPIDVRPGKCEYTTDSDGARVFQATPLSFFSCFYDFWRGSIEITVEVVCTKLHQGQLFIALSPVKLATTPTLLQLRTCAYRILDISQTTRHTEVIPFLSEHDYNSASVDTFNITIAKPEPVGYLYIMVQNPLTAPATLSDTVDINVFINAGSDFEFMMPAFQSDILFYDKGVMQGDDLPPAAEGSTNMQQSSEITVDLAAPPVDVVGVRKFMSAPNVCANVATAHTDNVLGREYILKSGIEWKDTDAVGSILGQDTRDNTLYLPQDFWDDDLAPSGLANFHEFQRMDFEVKARVNPSAFHAGQLLIAAELGRMNDTGASSMGTYTQFPHAFLDLAGETETTFVVPYANYNRLVRSVTKTFAFVNVFVWNKLRGPTGVSNKLYITLSVKALNPYIGVKRTNRLTLQGDVSDARTEQREVVPLFGESHGSVMRGYVRTRHTGVKDLMRRPDVMATFQIQGSALTGVWNRIARVPAFGGKIHRAIAQTYTYWSGTNKIWFISNMAVDTNPIIVTLGSELAEQVDGVDTQVYQGAYPNLFSGAVVPKMLDRFSFVVEVPMYKRTPLISTSRDANDWEDNVTKEPYMMVPYVDVFCAGASAGITSRTLTIAHSVGDDFQFYLPRAIYDFYCEPIVPEEGIVPAMTSNEFEGFIASGPMVNSSAYFAFDRSNATAVTWSGNPKRVDIVFPTPKAVRAVAFRTNPMPGDMAVKISAFTDSAMTVPAANPFVDVVQPTQVTVKSVSINPAWWTSVMAMRIEFLSNIFGGTMLRNLQYYSTGESPASLPMVAYRRSDSVISLEGPEDMSSIVELGMSEINEIIQGIRSMLACANFCASGEIMRMFEWLVQFADKCLTFVTAMVLLTHSDGTTAHVLGTLQFAKLFMGYLVPQHSKPVANERPRKSQFVGSVLQGCAQSFKEDHMRYACTIQGPDTTVAKIYTFVKYVRKTLAEYSGFSCGNLKKFIEAVVGEATGLESILLVVEAVIRYVIMGDDAIYELAVEKVQSFVEEVGKGVTEHNVKDLKKRAFDIDQLATRIGRHRLPDVYRSYCLKLKEGSVDVDRKIEGKQAIVEPIGIYIHSGPGCGKSTIMCQLLPTLLQSDVGFEGSREEFSVNLAMDSQGRIDKYDGQPFAIFDEFGSNAETNEMAIIIKFISQFAGNIDTALLDNKAKSFRSRAVLLLSNISGLKSLCDLVHNPEAVPRRFEGFSFQMVRNPDEALDLEKLYADIDVLLRKFEVDGVDASVVRRDIFRIMDAGFNFCPIDTMTGHLKTDGSAAPMRPWLFSEVYSSLLSEWRRKERIFKKSQDVLDRLASLPSRQVELQGADDPVVDKVEYRKATTSSADREDVTTSTVRQACNALRNVVGMGPKNASYAEKVSQVGVVNTCDDTGEISFEPIFRGKEMLNMRAGVKSLGKKSFVTTKNFIFKHATAEPGLYAKKIAAALSGRWVSDTGESLTEAEIVSSLYMDIKVRLECEKDPCRKDLIELDSFFEENPKLCGVAEPYYGIAPTTLEELRHYVKVNVQKAKGPAYPGLKAWLVRKGAAVAIATASVGLLYVLARVSTRVVRYVFEGGYDSSKWKMKPKAVTSGGARTLMLQGCDERHEKIRRNIRQISIGDGYHMSALCLSNRLLLLNSHFLDEVAKRHDVVGISLHRADGEIYDKMPLSLAEKDIIRYDMTALGRDVNECGSGNSITADLVLVMLKNVTIPRARDITSYIIPREEMRLLASRKVHIEAELLHMNCDFDISGKVIGGVCEALDTDSGISYIGSPAFGFATAKGDCGRPYVSKGAYPLLGLHYAKANEKRFYDAKYDIHNPNGLVTFYVPLYKEMVAEACAAMQNITVERPETEFTIVEEAPSWMSEVPIVLGEVQMGQVALKNSSNPTTQYRRMTIGGKEFANPEWEDEVAPAVLTSFGPHSALAVAIRKYIVARELAIPATAHTAVVGYWVQKVRETEAKPLTDDEAINGQPSGMAPLQWNTSPGWAKRWFKKGKMDIFEQDSEDGHHSFTKQAHEVIPELGKSFVQHYKYVELQAQKGIAEWCPWVASLKDELLPLAKVNAKRSRIFEMPSMEITLLIRKYFGQFAEFVKTKAGFNWCHGIGEDKEAVWSEYYRGLLRFSGGDPENCLDVDYTNYDATVMSSAFEFFRCLADQFYRNHPIEHQRARASLLFQIQEGLVVCGRHVLVTSQGNKSGNPLTDILNSVTNIYVVHCAIMIMQGAAGLAMEPAVINTHISMLTYGDDVVMAVDPKLKKSWFDLDVMQYILTSLGYKVTDGTKQERLSWKTAEELVFLKSHFVVRDGIVFAPMAKRSIYKELQWEKKKEQDDPVEWKQKIENTLAFMSHHGPLEYELFRRQLVAQGVPSGWLQVSYAEQADRIALLQRQHRAML